jgi:hypothetical protein
MNVEAYEQAMDAQARIAETIWRTDLYDSVRDNIDHERAEREEEAELNHLDAIQWVAIGWTVFVLICVLRLWPRG